MHAALCLDTCSASSGTCGTTSRRYRTAGRGARRQSLASRHRALGQARSQGLRHRTGGPFQNPGPPKTRDADQRHAKEGRRRRCLHGKSTWGIRAGRPRTQKGRLTPEGAGGLSSSRKRGKALPNEKGGPLGSPSPRRSLAPPRPLPAQRAPGAGGALVSHRVAPAVPSALAGLTSGFGMGPGVPRPPWPPAPGGRCGAGCRGRVALQGALGAAQRSRKRGSLRTVGGGGDFVCVPKGSAD